MTATSPSVGQEVEVSIRSEPGIPPRRGIVMEVGADGEFYVSDRKTFGHWYGGPGEGGEDSVFVVKVVGPLVLEGMES